MRKKVSFKNQKNQKLVGILNIPKGKPPFPAVIICHGFKGYKEQGHLKTLATSLTNNGFVVLRFDFTNEVGESYGKLENIQFSQELQDLESVISYISKQKFVDSQKIGLAGHSLGSQVVFHYAPSDKRVKVLAGLAGSYIRGKGTTNIEKNVLKQFGAAKKSGFFYVYSKRVKKGYKIKTDFYYDLIKHNTLAQVKKIKVPTLVLHGTKDSTVSISNSKKIYKLLKQPKKLAVIKGAPHTWRGKADPKGKFQKIINPIVVEWFKKHL